MSSFFSVVFFRYWHWYFVERMKLFLHAYRNFLVFGIEFFSIPLLVKTIFAPLHRYQESYGRGFDIKQWLIAATSNFIFRILGAMVRGSFIVIGIFFEAAIAIAGLVWLFVWLLLPFAIFAAFGVGFWYLIS